MSGTPEPHTPDHEAVADARDYLGKIVDVQVDRVLGSSHPTRGFVHPVNYGFVPGTRAPDGGQLDAYVLGVFDPVARFAGRCIAVLHRLDDADDKLIVVPKGREYSDDQIRALTEFQEQWFASPVWSDASSKDE